MLSEIIIHNVAVIEKATASFSGGFTVLTGETGAGKSILIDSINAIMGNRTTRDIVRGGAEKSAIWAQFSAVSPAIQSQLDAGGFPQEDPLLLQREISAEGKSAGRINGVPATAAVLRQLCGGLVNIHGQQDNQGLLNPAQHIRILDAYADNGALLAQYQAVYKELVRIQKEMEALTMDEALKNRKLDLLRHELEEIEGAGLAEGEEEQLLEQRHLAQNAQQITDALYQAHAMLTGDEDSDGAAVLLSRAASNVEVAAGFVPALEQAANALNEMYYSANEIAHSLQDRLLNQQGFAQPLDQMEQRLDVIFHLKQKYGQTVEAVLAYGARARQELETIEFSSQKLAELAKQEVDVQAKTQALATQLTQARTDAFARLNGEISGMLAFLNMPGIKMGLKAGTMPFSTTGQDEMEFLISTNPGEAPKPLVRIASGGELSRIMLAIKSALAGKDQVPTVIYDEIDTGISGSAADHIGQLLRNTAADRQVICVTHTAQIAAYAARHLLAEKKVRNGRTYTEIRELDREERVRELARIMSGDTITQLSLANAQEMLDMAQKA
ncbi:MAG: DNA repair protein RecN [Oscillospiraceae bacterium]